MSSNLKVNTILPSTGTTIGIGTVGGLINIVGNIDVNSTSGISTFNGLEISGIVTAKAGAAVTYYGDGSNLTGLSGLSVANQADNRLITATGTTDALNAEANLTLGNNLQFTTTANGHAVILKSTGNYYNKLSFDSGNTSAGGSLAFVDFSWDGDKVADILAVAGSDTTNKDDGHLVFRTSPSQGSIAERLRIASDGKITVAANSDIRFTNGTWTGEVAGKIQQNSNNLYIQGGTGGIRFRHASSGVNQFSMTNGGDFQITNGNVVVASGHGIDFSAASGSGSGSDSSLLDDYEEGSWSPLWSDATSGGTTTSNNMHGRYTKVGKLVTAHFWTWGLPVQGTNNAMYLQGLPFASGTIGATFHPIGCAFFNMGADNYHNLGLRLANNVTYAPLLFCRKDPGDKTPALFSGFINYYTNFEGTITYLTA